MEVLGCLNLWSGGSDYFSDWATIRCDVFGARGYQLAAA